MVNMMIVKPKLFQNCFFLTCRATKTIKKETSAEIKAAREPVYQRKRKTTNERKPETKSNQDLCNFDKDQTDMIEKNKPNKYAA